MIAFSRKIVRHRLVPGQGHCLLKQLTESFRAHKIGQRVESNPPSRPFPFYTVWITLGKMLLKHLGNLIETLAVEVNFLHFFFVNKCLICSAFSNSKHKYEKCNEIQTEIFLFGKVN